MRKRRKRNNTKRIKDIQENEINDRKAYGRHK